MKKILTNTFVNGVGLGVPLIFAVICIPVLIENLGVERFGVLTLMWAVVSYFGLFDLGLSRALTIQIAQNLAQGRVSEASRIGRSAIRLLWYMSAVAIVFFLVVGGVAVTAVKTDVGRDELVYAVLLLAMSLPAIVLTSGCRGILEAERRFLSVNMIRLPLGIYTFAAPAIASLFSDSLVVVSLVLTLGRWSAYVFSANVVKISLDHSWWFGVHDKTNFKELLKSSAWIALTNVLNPLIGYSDRFVIAVIVAVSSVSYYVSPYEIMTKLWLIPAAITAVVLPEFSQKTYSCREPGLLVNGMLLVGMFVGPVCFVAFVYAETILSAWIDSSFASNAAFYMKVFSVGIGINCLAHVPFVYLQGVGRADFAAKFQLVQLPLYLALLVFLGMRMGAPGVAFAWLFRAVFDALVILFAANVEKRARRAKFLLGHVSAS